MSGKSGAVSEEKAMAVAGSTALAEDSHFARIMAKRQQKKAEAEANKPKPLKPEEFTNALVGAAKPGEIEKAEHAIELFLNLVEKMEAKIDGESWRPRILALASKRSEKHEKAYKAAGDGGLYFFDTETAVPKNLKFFPLFATTTHKLFINSSPACMSSDGVRGVTRADIFKNPNIPASQPNYTPAPTGSVHDCGGATCPNIPYMKKERKVETGLSKLPEAYQSIPQQCCQRQRLIFLIDDQFTNIYQIEVKNQGEQKTYGEFKKTNFDPHGQNWWELGSFPQAYKNPQTGVESKYFYFEAKPTDVVIDPYVAKAIEQFKLRIEAGHLAAVTHRDNRDAVAQSELATLEANTTMEDVGDEHQVAFTKI